MNSALPFVFLGVFLNTIAQLLLKGGMNHIGYFAFRFTNILPIGMKVASSPYIISGLCCYVISVGVWLLALSRVEVSLAYPMLSLGYILNALAADYFFHEHLSATRIAGIFVIIFGVYLISRA